MQIEISIIRLKIYSHYIVHFIDIFLWNIYMNIHFHGIEFIHTYFTHLESKLECLFHHILIFTSIFFFFKSFFFGIYYGGEKMYGNKYKWRKIDIRRELEILEQKSFFFFYPVSGLQNQADCLPFLLFCRLVTIFFFFFGFYRWPRFNSLLIRCCSFRGSFADPNRVLELAELFSLFSLSLSLHGSFGVIVFWANGKPWFTFYSQISAFIPRRRLLPNVLGAR